MATVEAEQSVVLIMDYQTEIVANYASDGGLVERAAGVLNAARKAGIPVIYVVVSFREGYPEVGSRGVFQFVKGTGRMVQGTDAVAVHSGVAPKPGDVVVTKKRIGAFTGSDLEVILRSMGRYTLYMMGVATSGVVLSTVRLATDMDYNPVVITDCCSDRDEEVHRVLTQKVFPQRITAEEFLGALG